MSALAPTLYHAVRAELAIASHAIPLRLDALGDAANRALPFFHLNSTGDVESLSGETISDWLNRLRNQKPFYFHSTDVAYTEADRPVRTVYGKVGDGRATTRLAYSNEGAA
jgi:hypothetical protein